MRFLGKSGPTKVTYDSRGSHTLAASYRGQAHSHMRVAQAAEGTSQLYRA
ncbi:hypothetical protein HEB29_003207 [Streptomyces fulvorobeus]|uniref:Uncharacterized protein n=1 Tax=Streptomyces fulvorobeus TaxID=284028 RepID=A0A7Y9HDC5_9ACTN|nr:hypothetical protein [Streptomyces fulvorobeus]